MSQWIDVNHQLPEDGDHGLCAVYSMDNRSNEKIVAPFTFMDGNFHPYADEDNVEQDDYWLDPLYWPTHWMPLPEPPQ